MNEKDTSLTNTMSELEKNINEVFCSGPEWIGKIGIGCFYFGTTAMSLVAASDHCKSKQAHLAEIHDAETNDFLHNIVQQKSFDYWWIGGSDEAQVFYSVLLKSWF